MKPIELKPEPPEGRLSDDPRVIWSPIAGQWEGTAYDEVERLTITMFFGTMEGAEKFVGDIDKKNAAHANRRRKSRRRKKRRQSRRR